MYTRCATLLILLFISLPFQGFTQLSSQDIHGQYGITFNGVYEQARFGANVSYLGDINNDGFDDISICAPNATPRNIPEVGEIAIIFGHPLNIDSVFNIESLDGSNGFILRGANSGDRIGYGGANAAGDINNDGIDDLIIGTPFIDSDSLDTGGAYVIFGRANGFDPLIKLDTLRNPDGFILQGGNFYYDNFGTTGGYAGDMNNDGIDDFYVTADDTDYNGASSGTTYIIYGKSNFSDLIDTDTLSIQDGFLINGAAAEDNLGVSAASLGDFNNDGFDDLILGAFHANNDTGAGYVIFGQNGGFSDTLNVVDLNGNNGFTILGISQEDRAGSTVGNAGDINGDGFNDLFISAKKATHSGLILSGQTHIIYGSNNPRPPIIFLDNLLAQEGLTINGRLANELSGTAVSSLGDINEDGIDDLIIGALFSSSNGNSANGAAYVLFGQTTPFPQSINLGSTTDVSTLIIEGYNNYVRLGISVAGSGDFNGDNINDLLIGEDQGLSQTGNITGLAHLLLGTKFLSIDSTCLQENYTALRTLYLNTNGDNWINNSNWPDAAFFMQNTSRPRNLFMDDWYGVVTDSLAGCVKKIHLANNNLNGHLPSQIDGLGQLVELDLSNNTLFDTLPSTLGNLSNLTLLKLSNNQLTGNIPGELGDLSNLEALWLYDNLLNGCYENNLLSLCEQFNPQINGFFINAGNDLEAFWGDFCTINAGSCCPLNRQMSGQIPSNLYKASDEILSNNIISNNQNIQFKAGNRILLNNDFKVEPNAQFSAEIEGCEN